MYIVSVAETPKGLRLYNRPKMYYRSNFHRKYKGAKNIYTHPNKWVEAPNYLKKEQGGFHVYKNLIPLARYWDRSILHRNIWWCESGGKEYTSKPSVKESKWNTSYHFVNGLLVPKIYDIMNDVFCERIKLIKKVSEKEIIDALKEVYPWKYLLGVRGVNGNTADF